MMPLQYVHEPTPNSIYRFKRISIEDMEKEIGGKFRYVKADGSLTTVYNPHGFYTVVNGEYAIEAGGNWYLLGSQHLSGKLLRKGLISSSEIVFCQYSHNLRMDYQYLLDKLIEEERVAKNWFIYSVVAGLPELAGVVREFSVELVAMDMYNKV